jgi:membrane-associated protein
VLDSLTDLVTDSPATYLVVLGLVALDALLPIAPSETLVVTGGVLAADGGLSLPLLDVAAATGALAGHSFLYLLGRRTAPSIRDRLFRGERAQRRLDGAAALVRERTWLLIVSDFLPAGRTAAMFAAGALGLPARRFYRFIVPGALVWALVYTLLGIAGGSLFEEGWGAFAVSIGVAVAIGLVAEAIYRFRRRTPRRP